MNSKRAWLVVFIAEYFINNGHSFLLDESNFQCVWYGECGPGFNRGVLKCPATDTTKHAPLMTDPEGLRILRDYCPSLYDGDYTRTCCDVQQLKTLENYTPIFKRFLNNCPACLFNFFNLACQLFCSPEQGKFVWANTGATKPSHYTTGIPAITVVATRDYAKGLYDSCYDTEGFYGTKSLGFLCGKSREKCTPENWLTYMGSISNGQTSVAIDYVFTDGQPWTAPDGQVLHPLDFHNAPCNMPLIYNSDVIGTDKCPCRQCLASQPCVPNHIPTSATRKTYFDTVFGQGHYDTVEVIVRQTVLTYNSPAPSTDSVNFTSIYDKGFLLQVLDLQNAITNVTATAGGSTISLDDVCLNLANENECVIESVLQYYQNNATNINKISQNGKHDDYLDHLNQCVSNPTIGKDHLPYHMSCDPEFGGVTHPYIVLGGYSGDTNYRKATSFVITFLLKPAVVSAQTQAWKHAFSTFMGSYNNINMTINFMPIS